ncbi:hypothetical protein [Sphaerisporangium perillae]|uniref:hypothetical protein n=1 Tax=Sphaerisporangium perillae TaxID=2935860 RepID=UPI00200E66EF|nr:hypothetical protein [Sphaerisporangium perillae]
MLSVDMETFGGYRLADSTGTWPGRECVSVPDPQERLAFLGAAAARNPHASVVLGQVVRTGETLPVGGALDLESFAYSTRTPTGKVRKNELRTRPRTL